jgi:hypothetical protein
MIPNTATTVRAIGPCGAELRLVALSIEGVLAAIASFA